MLSKSSKYAIRAVLYLSENFSDKKKYSPKKIAKDINIPAPFLAKILQELVKSKLISSVKGRNGGFYLTEENKSNTLLSIVDCIDGLDKFQECILGLPKCSDEKPCTFHYSIAPLKQKMVAELTAKTIGNLTEEMIE